MQLIESFLKGKCCIDMQRSSKEDIKELSKIIKQNYPDSGEGRIAGFSGKTTGWYCSTLMTFYTSYDDQEVCYYEPDRRTYNGYHYAKYCPIKTVYTADEMLNALGTIKVANDSEIMNIFNDEENNNEPY